MKSNTQRDLVILLFLTFIAVLVWIGVNVFHKLHASTIDQQLNMQILPINPTFDTTTLNKLKQRQSIDPLYDIETATLSGLITPTPSSTQTPVQQDSTSSNTQSVQDVTPAQP